MILLANRSIPRHNGDRRANRWTKPKPFVGTTKGYIVSQNFVYTKDKYLKSHIGDILAGY
jgi:hypothetical protein